MRVLVAAAGDQGADATETLEAAGFSVERVETLAVASVRTTTVPVVVVGELRDAAPTELCDTVADADVDVSLVGLCSGGTYAVTVDGPSDERLPDAVRLAPHAAAYREAVDDLYERCRRRAEDDAPEVAAARQTATDGLDRARRLTGRTPYEHLFDG